MAISYKHPESGDTVARELWRWKAVYNDGSILDQFEVGKDGAIFHRSSEIEADKLDELQLVCDIFPTITFKVPDGATPVHFYRHKWVVETFPDPDRPEGSDAMLNREWRVKIWCIGFRIDKTYWLAYTDEYNHTVISSDKNAFIDKAVPEMVA